MFHPPPKVVICGSYKKGREELLKIERSMQALSCQILSPRSLNFLNTTADFVRTSSEQNFSDDEIERWHLQAISLCDFIWLHCPNGYIGNSGCFEIGYAYALNKPVFSLHVPEDDALKPFVKVRTGVIESLFDLGML
ncbi:MAG: hypothetical protein AAB624_01435 [Patescibacteria group bacterium]